jgi:hypothetical protein
MASSKTREILTEAEATMIVEAFGFQSLMSAGYLIRSYEESRASTVRGWVNDKVEMEIAERMGNYPLRRQGEILPDYERRYALWENEVKAEIAGLREALKDLFKAIPEAQEAREAAELMAS